MQLAAATILLLLGLRARDLDKELLTTYNATLTRVGMDPKASGASGQHLGWFMHMRKNHSGFVVVSEYAVTFVLCECLKLTMATSESPDSTRRPDVEPCDTRSLS
ncbi:hypothetical protein FKP32DRAFT_1596022 [Trametes sanguinea]|nr:hypothetical protein FKP32DRAFT_1596022 [Trametes sanguinea]